MPLDRWTGKLLPFKNENDFDPGLGWVEVDTAIQNIPGALRLRLTDSTGKIHRTWIKPKRRTRR